LLKLGVSDQICLETDHNCALNIVPEWARNKGFKVEIEETPYLEWKIYIKREQKKEVDEEVVLK